MEISHKCREIKDFPKEGVVFKDITKLLEDGEAFGYAIDELSKYCSKRSAEKIVGIGSRGYLFSAPVSYNLGLGQAIIRKPGKLPFETLKEDYNYEYSSGSLEIHEDSIEPGERVVIVDDILATGGTAQASINLVERCGGDVVGLGFLAEIRDFHARERMEGYDMLSLIKFQGDENDS